MNAGYGLPRRSEHQAALPAAEKLIFLKGTAFRPYVNALQ